MPIRGCLFAQISKGNTVLAVMGLGIVGPELGFDSKGLVGRANCSFCHLQLSVTMIKADLLVLGCQGASLDEQGFTDCLCEFS